MLHHALRLASKNSLRAEQQRCCSRFCRTWRMFSWQGSSHLDLFRKALDSSLLHGKLQVTLQPFLTGPTTKRTGRVTLTLNRNNHHQVSATADKAGRGFINSKSCTTSIYHHPVPTKPHIGPDPDHGLPTKEPDEGDARRNPANDMTMKTFSFSSGAPARLQRAASLSNRALFRFSLRSKPAKPQNT